MFRRFVIRDWRREFGLARAMLKQAQGVPGERLQWEWMKSLLLLIRIPIYFLLAVGGIMSIGSFLLQNPGERMDLFLFAASVFIGGAFVVTIGKSLVLPKDGPVLLKMPPTRRQVWRHTARHLRVLMALILLVGLFGHCGDFDSGKNGWLRALGWSLVPLALAGWQFRRHGLAGTLAMWIGAILLLVLLMDSILSRDLKREFILAWAGPFMEFLPSNWLDAGWKGILSWFVVAVWAVYEWWHCSRTYRWRVMAARMPATFVPIDPTTTGKRRSAGVQAEEISPAKPSGWAHGFLTSFKGFLLHASEREILRLFNIRPRAAGFYQMILAVVLLGFLWVAMESRTVELHDLKPLFLFAYPVVAFVLLRGTSNNSRNAAFRKFTILGERRIPLMGLFPVRERTLLFMSMKEEMMDWLLLLPARALAIYLFSNCLPEPMRKWHWAAVLVIMLLGNAVIWTWTWTWSLWQAMSIFPPGIVGSLGKSLVEMVYRLPLLAWTVAMAISVILHFLGAGVGTWVPVTLSARLAWTAGAFILVRRTYDKGRGSLVTAIPKVRRSFQITRT